MYVPNPLRASALEGSAQDSRALPALRAAFHTEIRRMVDAADATRKLRIVQSFASSAEREARRKVRAFPP